MIINMITITFGKYRGQTVKEVLDKDPSYLMWVARRGVEKYQPELYTYANKVYWDVSRYIRYKRTWESEGCGNNDYHQHMVNYYNAVLKGLPLRMCVLEDDL